MYGLLHFDRAALVALLLLSGCTSAVDFFGETNEADGGSRDGSLSDAASRDGASGLDARIEPDDAGSDAGVSPADGGVVDAALADASVERDAGVGTTAQAVFIAGGDHVSVSEAAGAVCFVYERLGGVSALSGFADGHVAELPVGDGEATGCVSNGADGSGLLWNHALEVELEEELVPIDCALEGQRYCLLSGKNGSANYSARVDIDEVLPRETEGLGIDVRDVVFVSPSAGAVVGQQATDGVAMYGDEMGLTPAFDTDLADLRTIAHHVERGVAFAGVTTSNTLGHPLSVEAPSVRPAATSRWLLFGRASDAGWWTSAALINGAGDVTIDDITPYEDGWLVLGTYRDSLNVFLPGSSSTTLVPGRAGETSVFLLHLDQDLRFVEEGFRTISLLGMSTSLEGLAVRGFGAGRIMLVARSGTNALVATLESLTDDAVLRSVVQAARIDSADIDSTRAVYIGGGASASGIEVGGTSLSGVGQAFVATVPPDLTFATSAITP